VALMRRSWRLRGERVSTRTMTILARRGSGGQRAGRSQRDTKTLCLGASSQVSGLMSNGFVDGLVVLEYSTVVV
jgi:hypothetical protein